MCYFQSSSDIDSCFVKNILNYLLQRETSEIKYSNCIRVKVSHEKDK
jgi:hypothetical protein